MAKKIDYTKSAKDMMKVGMTSMVGHGIIGGLSSVPGMPAQAVQTSNLAHSGLTLATTGQLVKTGLDIVEGLSPTKKKQIKDKYINKII